MITKYLTNRWTEVVEGVEWEIHKDRFLSRCEVVAYVDDLALLGREVEPAEGKGRRGYRDGGQMDR